MAKHTLDYTGKELDKLLGSIAGYVVRSSEKEDDGLYHVRGFKDVDSYNEWFADKDSNYELVLTHFTIPDTASTTASYVLNLTNGSGNYIVSTDGNVKVKLRFISALYNPIDQSTTDTGEQGVLTIQTRINENSQWSTKGSLVIQSLPKDSKDFIEVDISKFLADGQQQVRMIVRGDTSESSTNYVQMQIVKTALSLTFSNNWEIPITDTAIPLLYRISGAVDKMLHLNIDNGVRRIQQLIGTATYVETPYSITINDSDATQSPVCTQGVHTIEAWLTVNKEGVTVESEHVISQVLVILDSTLNESYIWFNDVDLSIMNWTEQSILKYAVYNSSGDTLPISFVISSYGRDEVYATYAQGDVQEGRQHELSNMIEIEDARTNFSARLDAVSNNAILKEFVLDIDNSQNFSPTAGADFIFNPKLRSNQETNRDTVINAANGEVIDAEFHGYGFVNDAYTTDENGNKCFRTYAGDWLHIKGYEAFSDFMGSEHTKSLTMEFDFAVRNITNENEPVLRMCTYYNGNPIGWEMKPLEAMFGTTGLAERKNQDIAWSEGVRTHVAVNIVYNLAASGINYIRIFINGKINREMSYEDTDTFVQYIGDIKTSEGILIGAPQAEIDIYGIRIYKKALSSSDVMQDYVASLPTSVQKLAFREANNILGDNGINYEYAKAKYNTLLWKPNSKTENGKARLAAYGDKAKQLFYGDLVVNIVGDPIHSGTLYNQNTQGQGTSSMSYWKWNQRFQPDEDGYFVNDNGERFDYWQLMDGMPRSSRNDAKLNWASSQQSHKLGATALYYDCWKKIIQNNTITLTDGGQSFTGTDKGYADCRVAVRQKSFMMFVQETDSSNPVFYGMYTMGPGKGDKPTFGYDKKKFSDFTVLEGCDNDKALVMHRVPWDNAIGGSLDDEVWTYNNEDNWELSMGSGKLWEEFKDAFNFVYLHHTAIKPYTKGNLATLKADNTADQSLDYWMTTSGTGYSMYDLYRYDIVDKDWVKAGIDRATLNLNTQLGNIATGTDWDAINEKFIQERIRRFRPYDLVDGKRQYREGEGVEKYYHVQDALFTMMFLRLVAATDNRGKNTYLYKVVKDDKIMFMQDDLDSIFPTDNVGKKTKPYYIEEHDINEKGQPYWNSSRNAFYNLMELAYPDEMKEMMNSILTAMSELGGGKLEGCYQKYFYDVQDGIPAIAYNEVARLLYEDAARAMVENRYVANTSPLQQCLGDQLLSEKEWNKKRSVYLSSYASFGEFASGEVSDAFAFRSIVTTNGQSPRYKFTVIPHQWIYPANGTGDSVFPSNTRVKAGETFVMPERTSDGNTNVRIHGINYYRSIGNLGDMSVGEALPSISGSRLTEFIATSSKPEFRITSITTVSAHNLELLDLTNISTLGGSINLSIPKRLKTLKLKGTSISSVTFPETDTLTNVELPASITSLRITSQPNLTSLSIEGLDNLQTVYIDSANSPNFDSRSFIESLYYHDLATGNKPKNITVLGVDWGVSDSKKSMPINMFMWLTSIPDIKITGRIAIEDKTTNPAVTFEYKNLINKKWGDVDHADPKDGLLLLYKQKELGNATISGNYYNERTEHVFTMSPSSKYDNKFTRIVWTATAQGNVYSEFSIDPDTGVLTTGELSKVVTNVVVSANIYYGDEIVKTFSKTIKVYDRPAQVGDVVYHDGTYGSKSDIDGYKTPIGICFYVAPRYKSKTETHNEGDIVEELFDTRDVQTRLMVGLNLLSAKSSNNTTYAAVSLGAYKDTGASAGLYATIDGEKCYLSNNILTTTTFYDIPDIRNISNSISGKITQANFRDESSEIGLLNDGFLAFPSSKNEGDGFAYNETSAEKEERTLTEQLSELAGDSYKSGMLVNSAYAKTLKIIKHRNTILTNGAYAEGSQKMEIFSGKEIPSSKNNVSEMTSLANLMDEVKTWAVNTLGETSSNATKWEQIYYPAASMAYAYEPFVSKGVELSSKFTAHNWFLPTQGLLCRLYWYERLSTEDVLSAPYSKVDANVVDCSESNENNFFFIRMSDGTRHNALKYLRIFSVRPICAF